ncbi:MAG TPA: hypothetical protein VK932_20900 [Kofleriaceae bacterium]|nr:hypothetical protein [Kofleriaceae bacterium]
MGPATLLLSLSLAFALAGCGGPSGSPASPPPPLPSETPPTTRDPGAVQDERPLQPSTPPAPEGGEPGAEPVAGRPDGAACLISSECASGVCEGEGCTDDRPGTCAPRSRACTKDLRQYCGCDGKTFGASGSCPGRRFAARGRCGA